LNQTNTDIFEGLVN